MLKDPDEIFKRISNSEFRSRFKLREKELQYLKDKDPDTIKQHAYDFITERLGPPFPQNDGKQTPMQNHHVFIAQHATAT